MRRAVLLLVLAFWACEAPPQVHTKFHAERRVQVDTVAGTPAFRCADFDYPTTLQGRPVTCRILRCGATQGHNVLWCVEAPPDGGTP